MDTFRESDKPFPKTIQESNTASERSNLKLKWLAPLSLESTKNLSKITSQETKVTHLSGTPTFLLAALGLLLAEWGCEALSKQLQNISEVILDDY